jgi:hypothetical protein
MRNRAKCKKCETVLESFHKYDYVECKCGEISITGGTDRWECAAKDWDNFLRIDDFNNELAVKIISAEDQNKNESVPEKTIPSKEELLLMLDEMINYVDNLPEHAKYAPVSQYDFYSFMMLIKALIK